MIKKKMYIAIIIAIVLILGLIFIYLKNYFSDPKFLTKNELYHLLSSNNDNYYDTFTKNDFMVRGVSSKEEYIEKIKGYCSSFTEQEKMRLRSCTRIIKRRLKNNGSWFDASKAKSIPIIFGCVTGKKYEDGLSHTRYPAIIFCRETINNLPDDSLMELILHELAHIYQKKYPNDVNQYLNENGFAIIGERNINDSLRANPDTDNYIYKNTITNQIYGSRYNAMPKSIGDVATTNYDHPFEEMAYQIEISR